ncbi:hypothetical protein DFJ73DRAFT_97048 [Zopfochytrium polystomum]|nr:hypothetical protein DFJ73DRAFT_97048 [Zopfochytrium polystomum]
MFENFFELPDADQYPDYYIKIKKPLALDIVRKRINAKEYKTMQEFESDLRLIAANAREYNIEGSSIYKEAVQLEKFFLAVIGKEAKVDEPPMVEPEPLEFVEVRGEKYKAGDYVYIANPNPELKPTIGQITSTFLDSQKHPSFVANWFLRPEQTVHKASMKFIENEVLKSNRSETYLAEDIVARCWVLFIKDYVRGKPKGADIKHVYACEHRYNDQGKTTSRIKQWNVPAKFKDPELELYEIPLQPVKLASVFAADDPLATNRKRKLSEDDESDGESPGARKSEEAKTQDESAPEAAHVEKRIRLTVKQPKPAESHAAAPSDTKPAEPTATTPALQKAPSTSQLSLARQPRLFDRTADGDLKWYASIPLDVVPPCQTMHSLDYLIWRAAKDSETKSTTKQVVRERTAEEALVLETLEGLASAFLAQ